MDAGVDTVGGEVRAARCADAACSSTPTSRPSLPTWRAAACRNTVSPHEGSRTASEASRTAQSTKNPATGAGVKNAPRALRRIEVSPVSMGSILPDGYDISGRDASAWRGSGMSS